MANTMKAPIIGLVENMSYIECPDCGKKIRWNEDKTSEYLKELDVTLLGDLPMIASINQLSSNTNNEIEDRVQEMVNSIVTAMNKNIK